MANHWMRLNHWLMTPLLLATMACSNKKDDAPPPPPLTVPHASIEGPWGAVSGGLSLHANVPKELYAPGEEILVRVAIANFGSRVRTFPAALSEPTVTMREDLVFLQCQAEGPPFATLESGQAYPAVLGGMQLAPGTYRLRIFIDAAERSADETRAWHGRLTSSDVIVKVAPPQ